MLMSITVRGYGVEGDDDDLHVVFSLSEVPGPAWIQFFRARSAYSRFDFTGATFRRSRLRVELPAREELASLLESVELLINAANIDHQFHLLTGDEV